MARTQDIALGLLFTGLGLVAAALSRSYTGASGLYPLVLGLVMAAIGTAIAVRAMRTGTPANRELLAAPGGFFIAGSACLIYLALIVPLGFYTASAVLMLALPVALGFRRPLYLVIVGVSFMLLVYLFFSVILEKPLPAEFWSIRRLSQG